MRSTTVCDALGGAKCKLHRSMDVQRRPLEARWPASQLQQRSSGGALPAEAQASPMQQLQVRLVVQQAPASPGTYWEGVVLRSEIQPWLCTAAACELALPGLLPGCCREGLHS